MFFEEHERVRIVKLENPLLPKRLIGAEGFIECQIPTGSGLCYGRNPFYWVRLVERAGIFCASVDELELITTS